MLFRSVADAKRVCMYVCKLPEKRFCQASTGTVYEVGTQLERVGLVAQATQDALQRHAHTGFKDLTRPQVP